ncbi:MAG: single-stranded DNA-binding protein [Christensenellales bacterium]|jgi:single-stranded DNA-binding protein
MDSRNVVTLSGIVASNPKFSHSLFHDKFYTFTLASKRLSNYQDLLPVTISESMCCCGLQEGDSVYINGQLRSYNKFLEGSSRLILTVFAREMEKMQCEPENNIMLTGYICKPVVFRTTPFNREIADILLAVNRQYNKSDYIPCIAWGKNARFASMLETGQRVNIQGRVQSREYEKKLDNGCVVRRTAYEVSIASLKEL